MNKIYNNLSIENFTKTEWFNQFNEKQQKQILLGIENKVNVSIYAKPEYSWEQMDEIKLGLKYNLDVSVYSKPEISWEKMREIRKQLLKESTL